MLPLVETLSTDYLLSELSTLGDFTYTDIGDFTLFPAMFFLYPTGRMNCKKNNRLWLLWQEPNIASCLAAGWKK
jgi:hypothetical protein